MSREGRAPGVAGLANPTRSGTSRQAPRSFVWRWCSMSGFLYRSETSRICCTSTGSRSATRLSCFGGTASGRCSRRGSESAVLKGCGRADGGGHLVEVFVKIKALSLRPRHIMAHGFGAVSRKGSLSVPFGSVGIRTDSNVNNISTLGAGEGWISVPPPPPDRRPDICVANSDVSFYTISIASVPQLCAANPA